MAGGFSLQERFPFLSGLRLDEGAKRHQHCTCIVLRVGPPCVLCPGASPATPKPKSCFLYPSQPSAIYTSIHPSTHLSIIRPAPIHHLSTHLFTHPSNLCPSIYSPHIHPSIHPFNPHFSLLSREQALGAEFQLNGGSRLPAFPKGKVGQSRGQHWDQHSEGPGDASPSVNQSVNESISHHPMCTHYTPGTVLGAGDMVGSKLDPSPCPSGRDGQ